MTYVSDEASVESGEPTELYEFVGSDPTVNIFRYTSADADVTFDPGDGGGSRTFTAMPMKRTAVQLTPEGNDPSITVTLPADCQMAKRYIFQIAPPNLYMTMFRCHIGVGTEEVVVGWEGEVVSWGAKENLAEFVIPNDLVTRINERIPRIKYQRYCNNALYDSVCGIAKSGNNIQAATVSSFPTEKQVIVSTVGGQPNGYWDGGEVTHAATGETRMILTQIGTQLTMLFPFSTNVDTTEAVTLARGCNHSLSDCRSFKPAGRPHGNIDKFTGFVFITSQQTDYKQGK